MLPKADSSSFVLFSLLFVLAVTDPPRTGKYGSTWFLFCFVFKRQSFWGGDGSDGGYSCGLTAAAQAEGPAGQTGGSGSFLSRCCATAGRRAAPLLPPALEQRFLRKHPPVSIKAVDTLKIKLPHNLTTCKSAGLRHYFF